jgi:hypothetical protein
MKIPLPSPRDVVNAAKLIATVAGWLGRLCAGAARELPQRDVIRHLDAARNAGPKKRP